MARIRGIRPLARLLCATAAAAITAASLGIVVAQESDAASQGTALCTGPQLDGTVYPGQKAACLITPAPGLSAGQGMRVVVAGPGDATLASCAQVNNYALSTVEVTATSTHDGCVFTIVKSAPAYTFGPVMVAIPRVTPFGAPVQLAATTCITAGCSGATSPLLTIGAAARVGVVSASAIAGVAGSAPALMLCSGTGPRGSTVAGSTVTCTVTATQSISGTGSLSLAPLLRSLSRITCQALAPGVAVVLPTSSFAGPACTFRVVGASVSAFTVVGTATYDIAAGTATGTPLAFSGFICQPPGCGGAIPELAVGGPGLLVGVVPDLPASVPAGSGSFAVVPIGAAGDESGTPVMSTIASSIATPAQAFVSVGHTLVSAAIAAALVLFITFPAALFNKTLEENYEEIRDAWERRLAWLRRMRQRIRREGGRGRLIAFILVLLTGAVLGGLLDPHFGFNPTSAISFGAVVLAILFGMTVPALANLAYRRLRDEDSHVTLHALPAGLAVAALCVIVSRVTQFQPGYLYGVIAGLVFTKALAQKEQGQALALATLATIVVAVLAWFVWLPAHSAAAGAAAPAALILLTDFLGAVFVGGLIGAALSMLPLRFLPGGAVMAWSRAAWAATLGVALFGVIEILLRPDTKHASNAPLVTTIVLFVAACALSVGFALYCARRKRRSAVLVTHQ